MRFRAVFFAVMFAATLITFSQEGRAMTTETATFAGGCFWCMQPPYDKLPGIVSVTVGYTGGTVPSPTYQQVTTGRTGHYEAVQIVFDPSKMSYTKLLDVFWHNIDPTADNGQFADIGPQYRTAIFYHSDAQKKAAEKSKAALTDLGKFPGGVKTQILPAKPFYPAEEYHQGYYKKNPFRYEQYKYGSGRAGYLKRTWGKQGEH